MAFSEEFEEPEDPEESEESEDSEDGDDQCKVDGAKSNNEPCEDDDSEGSVEKIHQIRHTASEPDLDDILHDDCLVPTPKPTGIISWLMGVYKNSRGFELGTFDASLLPVIWKEQSVNWNDLALGYVSDVVAIVHRFIIELVAAISDNDQRVQSTLMSMLMDGLRDCYAKSINHAKFIISVEQEGTPLTTNHYFADNLEK